MPFTGRAAGWLLLACAVLPFAGTRHFPHVHDDEVLRGVGSLVVDERADLATLWSADFFGTYDEPTGQTGFWRPLVLLGFAAEWKLAGGSSAGFAWLGHVLTILCHGAATLALWRLLLVCRLPPPGALLAGALFAVAPLHVESVAWASGRVDSLPAALVWGGATWWLGRRTRSAAVWGCALMVAALLCKETAAVLVVTIIPVAWSLGRSWRAVLGVPATALLAALVLRAVSFGLAAPQLLPEVWTGPAEPTVRWLTWLSICPDLVSLLVWPGVATPIRPVAPAETWTSPGVLAGAATVALAIAVFVWIWRRREPALLLGAGLVVGTLLVLAPWTRFPMGFVELAAPLADRYLYAAAAAPGILLGFWLGPRLARLGRTLWVVPLVLLATLGPVTAARAQHMWSSNEAFARAALDMAPGSANLWAKLGEAQLLTLRTRPDPAEAEAAAANLERALALQPDHRLAAINRFIVLAMLGHDDRARRAADDLLRRRPTDPQALDNVAAWHAGQGRWAEALKLYERELATGRALPGAAAAAEACRAQLAAASAAPR